MIILTLYVNGWEFTKVGRKNWGVFLAGKKLYSILQVVNNNYYKLS
jgi:hypothetical protein